MLGVLAPTSALSSGRSRGEDVSVACLSQFSRVFSLEHSCSWDGKVGFDDSKCLFCLTPHTSLPLILLHIAFPNSERLVERPATEAARTLLSAVEPLLMSFYDLTHVFGAP